MAAEQLVQRMLAMESGVDSARLAFGQHSDRDERKISQSLGVLSDLPIYFDDSAMLTVAEMRAKARRLQLERGLDLVVVDYLQLMQSGTRNENRVQEVSYVSRSLKQLARDLDVPVVACSQLSRASEIRASNVPSSATSVSPAASSRTPTSSCSSTARTNTFPARSGTATTHGDENARELPAGITQIVLAKHRNGPTGTIHLRFREKIARFEDLLVRQPEEWEDEPLRTEPRQ